MNVEHLIAELEQLPGYYEVDVQVTSRNGNERTAGVSEVAVCGQHDVRVVIS